MERPDRIELPCDRVRPAIRNPTWTRLSFGGCDLAAFAMFVGKIANARDFVIGTAGGTVVVHLEVGEARAALRFMRVTWAVATFALTEAR